MVVAGTQYRDRFVFVIRSCYQSGLPESIFFVRLTGLLFPLYLMDSQVFRVAVLSAC